MYISLSTYLPLQINSVHAYIERILDVPGYIPGISQISAIYRYKLASYQAIIGIAALAFGCLALAYRALGYRTNKHQIFFQIAGYHVRLCITNLVRSFIEATAVVHLGLIAFDYWKFKNGTSDIPLSQEQYHTPLLFR